jgi:hypothetical protein
MSTHFEATDPRGRKVICSEGTWHHHILDFHPEMEGAEDYIVAAIDKPALGIFRDVDYADREIYYGRPPGKRYYIKVVVAFGTMDLGDVKTAYRADSPKAGEKMLWPTSSD